MMKMMSVGIDSSSNKDLDYSQLLAQNKVLQSELIQCQADKDFVWSLWKRLQVSNPDVTDAISQVLQREKEKAEAKDHRVLEILQVKDDRIEELQNIVAKQAQEISELLSRKVDLQEKCAQYQTEVERLQDAVTPLEMKLKGFETKERSMDEAYRRTVEDSQREKHELQRRLTALTTELEVVREEKSSVADKRLELERTVRHLERDVSEKISKFDGLIKELEDTRLRAERAERRIQQFTQEVDFKNRELETVRKELKELWNNHNQLTEHSAQQAELIRQLQSLQHDTQIMIKNQEDAFSMEANSLQQMYADITSRYEKAKQNEADLRQQILELKKDLMDRDDAISKLEGQAKVWKEQLNNMNHGGSFLDLDLAAADRSTLEARRDLAALRQLERTLGKLDQSREQEGEDTLEFDVSYTQQTGRHSTPSRTIDRKLADTQQLLELKCRELDAIKKAHSRRLERLRAVQKSEKLLQEQLKVMEDTQTSRNKKKVQRSDPKLLQREDSDAVWNELAYFKSQNRSLEVERRNLQEEVDELRVQASTDAATQHELRVQLQAQQEEFEYQLKKWEAAGDVNNKTESELVMLKSRLQNRDMHIGKLEKDLQELASSRDTLLEEKKFFKNQANELQQELSQCRIQLADLRQTVQRQQRALEESSLARTVNTGEQREAMRTREAVDAAPEIAAPVSKRQTRHRATHKVRKPRRPASSVKEYQRVLNRSIEKMRNLFSSFHDDGWEEVSESGATEDWELEEEWEGDDDTEVTGESLGVAIVRHAHNAFSGDLIDFSEISPATEYAREPSGQAKVGVKSKLHQGPVKANVLKTTSKDAPTRSRSPASRTHDHNPEVRAKSPVSRSRRQDHSPPVRDRVILRETATSPIPWGSIASTAPQAGNKQESKNNGRLLGVLRKRVAHLQQQLSVFKESRAGALKILKDLKESNLQLSSDLAQANQRLRIAKQNCQRLSGDLERVQKEKQSTEQQLKEELADVPDKQQDCDKRLLEAKLKMANSEVARQAATIRSLKTEVDSLQDQIRGLQDRVNHLERDNNQKRSLVESQRIKLKAFQDSGKAHDDAMEELQTKLKLTNESTEKMRIQLDSTKKRIRVITREKRDYEDKFLQASLSLEKKAKELSACRERCSALETALAQLEGLNQQQLQRLASHSEAAVDTAQAQVAAAHKTLSRYQQFVRLLARELLERVKQARVQLREITLAREEQAMDSDVSLKRARETARDILNISQSDLDDIMSADGDHETEVVNPAVEEKKDRKWMRRCDKMITSKEDFVQPLISLMLQKVDERADLMVRVTS